jgi:hypothetical protein
MTIKDQFGNVVCTSVVQADGSWSCTPSIDQGEGRHTYIATQTDAAGNTSSGSNPVIITFDIDTDSASFAVENAAPNGGDGNGDGTLDSDQQNVASKPNTVNSNLYVSLDLGNSGCNNVTNLDFTAEQPLSTQDLPYDYPIGLFKFRARCATPGQTVNVTFVLDKLYNTAGWTYRKYNSRTQVYTTVPGVSYGTKQVGSNTVTTISFQAVEGGPLDEDGLTNGEFIDPSGPTVSTTNSNNNGNNGNSSGSNQNNGTTNTIYWNGNQINGNGTNANSNSNNSNQNNNSNNNSNNSNQKGESGDKDSKDNYSNNYNGSKGMTTRTGGQDVVSPLVVVLIAILSFCILNSFKVKIRG